MITGLYSAATAMEVAARRHEVTAENLASAQMPGYRRRMLPQNTFESMVSDSSRYGEVGKSPHLGTAARPLMHDFTQGALKSTGRSLDVAISGEGFFSVDGPEGPLYTRNGVFQVDQDGTLMTIDRLPVRGIAGNIRLPPQVSSEGLLVLPDGRLMSDGVEIGQLELTRFENPEVLVPAGSTLYHAPTTAVVQPFEAQVQQGYLEMSNVSTVGEMADMINTSRQYDAAQRALNTISESIQKRIGLR